MRLFSRRVFVGVALAGAAIAAVSVWQLDSGARGAPSISFARAARADVVVTVGGVGRIVESRAFADLLLPSSSSSKGSSSGSSPGAAAAGTAPADSVFPRASGQLLRYLVRTGQRVRAGQAVALVDDGGVSAAAVRVARGDVATALLDLRQKQTHDPLRGPLPTRAEIAAAAAAVPAARKRLAQLLASPRRADVRAAQSDLRRAEADLETLLGGSQSGRADAVAVAQSAVDAAQAKLDRLLAPPNPADVAAAQADLKKSQADLAVLQRPAPRATPQAIAAAQALVEATRQALDAATSASPPVPQAVATAQADYAKAQADLAALQQAPPGPLPEEIASAQAAVDSAQQKLARVQAPADPSDVAAARLELLRAQADLRARLQGPAPATLSAGRASIAAARAKLAQLRAGALPGDVASARAEIARARGDLVALRARGAPSTAIDRALARVLVATAHAKLAAAQLAHALLVVRAPAAGTVTNLSSARGAPVDPTTPVAEVADLDHLSAHVALSEFDVARVRRGQTAVVSVDALGGERFTGRVAFASLVGTDSGGIVTFPTRVDLRRPRGLRPGMSVSVRIVVAERRGVLTVPLEAVSGVDEDAPTVDVLTNAGETRLRHVVLGLQDNKRVQIVRGLRAGERVLLGGGSAPGA